ncbi:MAG: hypothetical protein ACSHWU_01845 [Marinicella sp.]
MKKTMTLITMTLTMAFSLNAAASAYDKANWYFSADIEQLRSKIVPLLPTSKSTDSDFSIKEHIPTEVQQFTAYGHSEEKDDISLVLNGDFRSFALNDYLINLMYMVEDHEEVNVALYDTTTINGRTLEHFRITGKDESKSFYSSKLNNETIVVSLEENEVKNWINDRYSNHELSSTGMVSVLVNIESAMAHMGADLSSNSKPFNSAVFQKITQFSASIYSVDENLALESALSTADEATARQLEQVINGLIAMNALSNLDQDNELLAALLASLNISNQGKDLLITTEFALSLIPTIDFD